MKTAELFGAALDWAVATAEGYKKWDGECFTEYSDGYPGAFYIVDWRPSIDWSKAGPIIEREEISISREFSSGRVEWAAWTPAPFRDDAEAFGYGTTPLEAAMRCYVASKLGDEVEVPDELLDFAHD